MKNCIIKKVNLIDEKTLEISFESVGEESRMTITMPSDKWYDLLMLKSDYKKACEVNNHLAERNKELFEKYKEQLMNCTCLGNRENNEEKK